MSTATAAEGVARQRMWAAATWTVPGFLVLVPGGLVLLSFAEAGEPVVWSVYLLPLLLAVAIWMTARQPTGTARGVALGFVLAFGVAVVSLIVVTVTL